MSKNEREYYALTLVLERRKCLKCGTIREVPHGPFLNERVGKQKHLIRIDQLNESLLTILDQVPKRIKYLEATFKTEGCQDCFKPTEEGQVFAVPFSEGLSVEQVLNEKKHGGELEMFSLADFMVGK